MEQHKLKPNSPPFVPNKRSPPFVPKQQRERLIRSHNSHKPKQCSQPSRNVRNPQQSIQTPPCTLSGFSASSPSVISMGSYPPNTQFIGFPVTKAQLNFLLNRELEQRNKGNAKIDKRKADDLATFTDCEKTLAQNIEREQRVLDVMLEALAADSAEKAEMQNLINQIADLDAKVNEAKQKKLKAHTKRKITLTMNENKRLLRDISNADNQISYWTAANKKIERETERISSTQPKRDNLGLCDRDAIQNAKLDMQIAALRKKIQTMNGAQTQPRKSTRTKHRAHSATRAKHKTSTPAHCNS